VATLTTQSHLWLCHWERIERGPSRTQNEGSLFWICEYPYRSIRAEGPTEDCAGCPVWEALQKDARAKKKEPAPARLTAIPGRKPNSGGGHAA
jgi:hypothetical protein